MRATVPRRYDNSGASWCCTGALGTRPRRLDVCRSTAPALCRAGAVPCCDLPLLRSAAAALCGAGALPCWRCAVPALCRAAICRCCDLPLLRSAVLALCRAGAVPCWRCAVPALCRCCALRCWRFAVLALCRCCALRCWRFAVLALCRCCALRCWRSAVLALCRAEALPPPGPCRSGTQASSHPAASAAGSALHRVSVLGTRSASRSVRPTGAVCPGGLPSGAGTQRAALRPAGVSSPAGVVPGRVPFRPRCGAVPTSWPGSR